MMIMKNYIREIIAVILSFFMLSCNKTEYEQETRPYTDILSFEIMDQHAGREQLEGIVFKDSIIVYWNPDVDRPTTITPTIEVAAGASISPASGIAIPFSEEIIYTVTAENGQSKEYVLKVKTHREVPILSAIVGNFDYLVAMDVGGWTVAPNDQEKSGAYLNFLGEYFLTTGDVNDIKVYMQRLHDGYEFDLPVNRETVTNTSLQVEMPKFSIQLDTGRHRVWVQIGDLVSDSKDIFMRAPHLSINGTTEAEFLQMNSEIYAGQTLTMKYRYSDDLDGAITRYYEPRHLHTVHVNVRAVERTDTTINSRTGEEQYREVYKYRNYLLTDFNASSTEVNFSLPEDLEEFVGGNLMSIQFLYEFINEEGVWTHLNSGGAVQYGQSITFSRGVVTSGTSREGPPIVSAENRR